MRIVSGTLLELEITGREASTGAYGMLNADPSHMSPPYAEGSRRYAQLEIKGQGDAVELTARLLKCNPKIGIECDNTVLGKFEWLTTLEEINKLAAQMRATDALMGQGDGMFSFTAETFDPDKVAK